MESHPHGPNLSSRLGRPRPLGPGHFSVRHRQRASSDQRASRTRPERVERETRYLRRRGGLFWPSHETGSLFRRIQGAYETLSDPKRARRAYDALRSAPVPTGKDDLVENSGWVRVDETPSSRPPPRPEDPRRSRRAICPAASKLHRTNDVATASPRGSRGPGPERICPAASKLRRTNDVVVPEPELEAARPRLPLEPSVDRRAHRRVRHYAGLTHLQHLRHASVHSRPHRGTGVPSRGSQVRPKGSGTGRVDLMYGSSFEHYVGEVMRSSGYRVKHVGGSALARTYWPNVKGSARSSRRSAT